MGAPIIIALRLIAVAWTAVVPIESRSAGEEISLRSIHHRLSLLLLRVLVGYAGLTVACAQAVPGFDDAAWNPARVISSTGSGQALGDNAPVVLKTAIETLDIDGNGGIADALTDGLLVVRYLYGLRGPALVQGAVGPGAGRTTTQIESYLSGLTSGTPVLDIDGNATTDALTDGLLVIRYLFGERGALLIQGVVGAGASRTTSGDIEGYLATLTSSTPQPPSGCSVTAVPASSLGSPVQPGTPVQLTANCTSGPQPITYTWDGGAFTGSVRTVAPTTTTSYSVIAANAAGSAPAVNTPVYVSAPTSYCQPGDQVDNIPWPPSGQTRRSSNGFVNRVYSVSFTVPATFNPPLNINHLGFVRVIEIPGQPVVPREFTVSKSACDFHAGPGGYMLDNFGAGENSLAINFTVNNPTGYQLAGAYVNFQSGDTIYVSVRNYNYNNGSPTPTCPSGGTCDIYFDFATPNRY
jgi:hypothetical protein